MLSFLLILLAATIILGVVFVYWVADSLKTFLSPYNFLVAIASIILWSFGIH